MEEIEKITTMLKEKFTIEAWEKYIELRIEIHNMKYKKEGRCK
jgi:hypothetical protein